MIELFKLFFCLHGGTQEKDPSTPLRCAQDDNAGGSKEKSLRLQSICYSDGDGSDSLRVILSAAEGSCFSVLLIQCEKTVLL
ncbi:MAG: hypothetical protein ACYCWE_03260 [Eubacteriales bacterium]